MKISLRIWILVICLALAAMIIINGSTSSKLLAGFIVVLVPIALTYVNSKVGKVIVILVLVLNFSSILLNIFTNMNYFESLRIVFGSVYVLFLPGFIISFIFFPKTQDSDAKEEGEKGSIDWIERIALSFALSISIIPLAVFYLNLIGIKINAITYSLFFLKSVSPIPST